MSTAPAAIEYPFCDGEPMADNMRQARWMLLLYGNLDALLDCFVGCNNFWFPREGEPELRVAPDVYVAFGRPKGHRDSYNQWDEGDVPVTVAFEILSPGNKPGEMADKLHFYEEYGVEEYYVYDPERNHLTIWTRGPHGAAFASRDPATFVSPRMGIRFDFTSGPEMVVRESDGRPFLWTTEMKDALQRLEAALKLESAARRDAETRAALADVRAAAAEERAATAEAWAAKAEADRQQAEARATAAEAALQRVEAARQQSEARAARLAELGPKARRGLATADELAELDRLEEGAS